MQSFLKLVLNGVENLIIPFPSRNMLVFVEFSTRSSGNSLIFLEESGERKLDNIQQKNSPFQFITKLLSYYRHFDKASSFSFCLYLDSNYD